MAASQVKSQVIVFQGLLSVALLFGGGCDNSTNEREEPKEPTKTTPAVISQTTTLSVEGMVCDACACRCMRAMCVALDHQQWLCVGVNTVMEPPPRRRRTATRACDMTVAPARAV